MRHSAACTNGQNDAHSIPGTIECNESGVCRLLISIKVVMCGRRENVHTNADSVDLTIAGLTHP